MKPQDNVSDSPPDAPVLLTYGTHDRSGPWWLRWLRAWARAAKPALIAAAVAGALAYSVAPRQYTAVATVHVDPDLITVSRGNATSAAQDAARADTVARSLKNTNYLAQVLNSADWRNARFTHPGQTLFEPISAEPVPGTSTVRVKFTDPNPEAARVGADATVLALSPMFNRLTQEAATAAVRERLAPVEQREKLLRTQLAAAEGDPTATSQPAPRVLSNGRVISGSPSRAIILSRQHAAAQRQITAVERQLASTPQIRRGEPAAVPRFASNQKELAATGAVAGGVVFPLAFVLALYYAWRYARTATVQAADVDRIMSVEDLADIIGRSRVQPLWSAARRALGPATVAAAIAAAVACSFAPRRYTATATITAAPATAAPAGAAPSTAPTGTATPAEAIAALAEETTRPEVLRQVTNSQQWQVAKVRDADSRGDGRIADPRIDVSSDPTVLVVRFTDNDRAAARYGADAAINLARGAMRRVTMDARFRAARQGQLQQLRSIQSRVPPGSNSSISLTVRRLEEQLAASSSDHSDAVRLAVAQLPAAVTTVSMVPSNYAEMLRAAVQPASLAFALAFVVAMCWVRRREVRLALRRAAGEQRVAAAATAFKPAAQLAAVAAVFAGLVGYTATPRTYTAAAALQIYAPAPRPPPTVTAAAAAAMMPNVPPVRSPLGERPPRMVPSAAIQPDLSKGTLRITYTDPDPDVAASCANAIASSLVQSWHRNIHHLDLFTMFGPRRITGANVYPTSRRELEEWSLASAGCEVKVADAATPPSWADQFQPLKNAGVVAAGAFLSVLFALELLRAPRVLREQAAAQPAPA